MDELNWALLIRDISEALVLTQKQLGEEIGTTQQSVSNWLNGRRIPCSGKAEKFFILADKAGIDPSNYKLPKKELSIRKKSNEVKSLPPKIRRICLKISELHPRRRKKVMNYLEDMLETIERNKRTK